MNLALFGGSFNPIHNAHLFIAEEVSYHFKIDKFFFMPTYMQPLKLNEKFLPEEKRVMLIKSAIKGSDFLISDYEIKKKGISYSIDTIDFFLGKYKPENFYFVIGGDSAYNFDRWKAYKEILKKVKPVVFPRKGYEREKIEKKFGKDVFMFLEMPVLEISSTMIRNRIKNGAPIRYLVPDTVYEIIKGESLYL